MKCPKCRTEDLLKEGFGKPFSCPECSGMWLDKNMKATSFSPEDTVLPEITAIGDHDDKTGLCPACHGILIRAKVDDDAPFYLERCSACGGIWFDRGELQTILENKLFENLADFWSRSWQQKQRKEKERSDYLALNRAHLGESVFDTVLQLSEILKNHPEKNRAVAFLQQEIGL